MPRGLVVMWLAIGSEFPGSNPGYSGNLFFEILKFLEFLIFKLVFDDWIMLSKLSEDTSKSTSNALLCFCLKSEESRPIVVCPNSRASNINDDLNPINILLLLASNSLFSVVETLEKIERTYSISSWGWGL